MKKILLITTRSIYKKSGEQRLIRNRAKALKELYGVDTNFIAFISEKKVDNEPVLLKEFDNQLFCFKNLFDLLLKYFVFIKNIVISLRTNEYDCIILSGVFLTNIAKKIKKNNKNSFIVADIHGTIKELVEFNATLKRRLVYLMLSNYENKMLQYVDEIFVVTSELKHLYLKKAKKKIPAHIIPCALENKDYTYEQVIKYRKKWRDEFGVSDNEILFIYSGGNSPWQSVDESYVVFTKFKSAYSNAKFLIMSNTNIEQKYEDVIYRSFSADRVFEVLFAGDIGFLIRSECSTNKVAFPNKYLEYVRANLEIISTPYLSDISQEIESENIGLIVRGIDSFEPHKIIDLLNKKNYKAELERRKKIFGKYDFRNTLNNFVSKL